MATWCKPTSPKSIFPFTLLDSTSTSLSTEEALTTEQLSYPLPLLTEGLVINIDEPVNTAL